MMNYKKQKMVNVPDPKLVKDLDLQQFLMALSITLFNLSRLQ